MSVNVRYKDTVFVRLFNEEALLRELYNALAGTDYDSSARVDVNTLPDVFFMERKNDLSFVLDNRIVVMVEHQATVNPNMPLRFLVYIARIYEKLVENSKLYRHKQTKIPRPEFYVIYNGVEEYPDAGEMSLSGAFMEAGLKEPCLELRVKVYNINRGHNKPLLQRSRTLGWYAVFIGKIRELQEELKGKVDNPLEKAVKGAISWCIEHDILKDFLKANASEVTNMLLSEFTVEDAIELAREEGMEKGREETREEDRERFLSFISQVGSLDDLKKMVETRFTVTH